ncbi:hypothetical protein [Selenomonas sp. AB3002]|jgi:hypothetical protein|uniref:hypothetical protein n=1 Tax=Selenomonas sp. AB3002 TaxID=1392502 RepID=UPI00049810BC
MKKCIAFLLSLMIMAFATVCLAAESYQMTYEAKNFTEGLKNDQALTETFTTPYGPLKFQMRKLWQASSDNRLHLKVWLNDKKIADEHFPKVEYGYTFRVLKNTSNSEQFYVLQSIERACLFGYSPNAQKLEVYIDSQNYAHEAGAYPYIVALKNGNLVLAFEKGNNRKRYQFNWDANANWFGYSDIGAGWGSVSSDKQ